MILGYLLAGLTLLTVVVVIIPLLREKNKFITSEAQQHDLAVYREREQALQQALQADEVTQKQFDDLLLEAQRELLQATASDETKPLTKFSGLTANWLVMGLIILGIPLVTWFGYAHWGHSNEWLTWQQEQQQMAQARAWFQQFDSPGALIEQLQQRVEQSPNDPEGWRLLGRMQLANQQTAEAVQSFAKAYDLAPDDNQIQLQYAEAIYLEKQQITPLAQDLLNQILTQQPRHPTALNLLAIGAFQQGDYQQAIDYWQKLLQQQPPDSRAAEALQASIQEARNALAQEE